MRYIPKYKIIVSPLLLLLLITVVLGCTDEKKSSPVENENPNEPPGVPSTPFPADGSAQVILVPTLTWECTDPEADPLRYDFYFGTIPDDLALTGTDLTDSRYTVAELQTATVYYWQVIAYDDHQHSTVGPVWSFTTLDHVNHFTPVPPTGTPYAIVITSAVIDGETMVDGDEIAVFDGDLCTGSTVIAPLEGNGTILAAISAWQGDPSYGLVGFTPGNQIIFKIWSVSAGTEYVAEAVFEVGNGTFGVMPYSQASLTAVTN